MNKIKEKAESYAREVCGDNYSELLNDFDEIIGAFCIKDFMAGYNEALYDNKVEELKEMLEEFIDSCCGEQECEEELIKGLGNTLYNSVFKAKNLLKQIK